MAVSALGTLTVADKSISKSKFWDTFMGSQNIKQNMK